MEPAPPPPGGRQLADPLTYGVVLFVKRGRRQFVRVGCLANGLCLLAATGGNGAQVIARNGNVSTETILEFITERH